MAYDDQIEVDREYLWALEVIACAESELRADQQPGKVEEAKRVLNDANLKRPRHPTGND
jgi:hypothetical protein